MTRRQPLLLLCVVCACALTALRPAAAQNGADSASGTEAYALFYLRAWEPVFAGPAPRGVPGGEALLAIASLARAGRFAEAEARLAELDRDPDPRVRYLTEFFRQETERLRDEILSAEVPFQSDTLMRASRRSRRAIEAGAAIDRLLSTLPPDDQTRLRRLIPVNVTNSMCRWSIAGRRANIEWTWMTGNSTPREIQELQSTQCERWFAQGLLQWPAQEWRVWLAVHRVAQVVAAGDPRAADPVIDDAIRSAEGANIPCLAGYLHLAKGDVRASPFGMPLTLGLDPGLDHGLHFYISRGVDVPFDMHPPASALSEANHWYDMAQRAFVSCPSPTRHLVALRRAHVARMRNAPDAANLYAEASRLAAAVGAERDARVLSAAHAILTSDDVEFARVLTALQQSRDVGATLTVAAMLAGAAVRIWARGGDWARSSRLLEAAIPSLDRGGFEVATVDLRRLLASVYGSLGRYEAAISTLLDALRIQRQHTELMERLASGATDSSELPLYFDVPQFVQQARSDLGYLLQEMAALFGDIARNSGENSWLDQMQRSVEQVASTNPSGAAAESARAWAGMARWNRLWSVIHRDLRMRRSCTAKLRVLDEARSRLAEMSDILSLAERNPFETSHPSRSAAQGSLLRRAYIQLDLLASRCAPQRRRRAAAAIAQERPTEAVRQAAAALRSSRTGNAVLTLYNAMSSAQGVIDQALIAGATTTVLDWASQLDALARSTPEAENARHSAALNRARALLALDRAAEAIPILETVIQSQQADNLHSGQLRLASLAVLIEAHAAVGHAEAALWARERFVLERRGLEARSSGVFASSPESAELAMLDRQFASGRGLTDAESARRASLRESLRGERGTHVAAPSAEQFHEALERISSATTLLAFHVGSGGVFAWRSTPGQPLLVLRLRATVERIGDLALDLTASLSDGLETWSVPAARLYDMLIRPLGPLRTDARLFVTPPTVGPVRALDLDDQLAAFVNLPFDVLGPTVGRALLAMSPIAYSDLVVAPDVASSAPAASRHDLVVAVNAGGLQFAESEGADIVQQTGASGLIGAQATHEAVLAALPGARRLHFATHGTVIPENPYQSSLLLAGGQSLPAWELFENARNASVVVLSACDTRRGVSGARGAYSLAVLAHGAGARWVLATRGPVNDAISSALMRAFYRHLNESHDPPTALLRARREVLASGADVPRVAPFALSASSVHAPFE